ncbi:hypothetical protein HK104_005367 [Borealophlyctis nickersoniae]|nr:hypothetical protein HK104_005367 [Borealophlyctis nickersoniae]
MNLGLGVFDCQPDVPTDNADATLVPSARDGDEGDDDAGGRQPPDIATLLPTSALADATKPVIEVLGGGAGSDESEGEEEEGEEEKGERG